MLATEKKALVEAHAIEHATERLIRRYARRHDPATIRLVVAGLVQRYASADIHAFVPVLIEREAREVLDATSGPAAPEVQPAAVAP